MSVCFWLTVEGNVIHRLHHFFSLLRKMPWWFFRLIHKNFSQTIFCWDTGLHPCLDSIHSNQVGGTYLRMTSALHNEALQMSSYNLGIKSAIPYSGKEKLLFTIYLYIYIYIYIFFFLSPCFKNPDQAAEAKNVTPLRNPFNEALLQTFSST